MRSRMSVATMLVVVLLGGHLSSGARAAAPATVYYLALGDSLSTGGGADPGQGYVDDIYAQLSQRIPGLQLENLGCGGDTTTRMINGGLCHDYTTGNQLGDAEQFLRAHPGQVSFVTIDVGGDDVDGCGISGTINPTCVTKALSTISTNLPTILSGLRAAGGNIPLVGMNYYDPYLAAWYSGAWFHGPPSQALAMASLPVLESLNQELTSIYGQFGAPTADVATPFETTDWDMTGSYNGVTLPQNVANVCNWTHMCMTGGGNPNIHTTDFGHSLIATAFEGILEHAPAVLPGTATVVEGNGGTTALKVPVTLSAPPALAVTAHWTTLYVPGAAGNQADPATDYAPAGGTVAFAPGQTAATVTIAVKGDTLVEPDEYIVVSFTDATNATIGGVWGLGVGTIANDDHAVVLPGTASIAEGNSGTTALKVPVTLSNPSTLAVSVHWTTLDVPGAAGNQADPATDYAAAGGTVTFAPGQTATSVTIEVNGDTLVEPDEYIIVSFTDPTNATIGGVWGLGVGTILNDD